MKKLLSVLMVAALTLGLTACGGSESTEPEATDPVTMTGKEVFKNVNARLAVSVGFDKEFIVNDIFGNGSFAANYFVPRDFVSGPVGTAYEGVDFRDGADTYLEYSPEKAAEYWAAAKEELGFTNAEIEFLIYDSDSALKVAEHIQEELQTNLEGLTVTLKPIPFSEKLELADNGDFEMNFAGWGPDYPDPMTFIDMWITGGGYNEANWSNADYDSLVERSKSGDLTSDLEGRWEALLAAEKILMDNAVIAPIYQRNGISLVNPELTGWVDHQFGPDYSFEWVSVPDKVLNLVETSDIPTMDTNNATDSVSFLVMGNTIEGLFQLVEGDIPEPALVDSYVKSDDGLTYTFTLKQGVNWVKSDGSVYAEVTANDFVYSWDRLVSEDLGAQYSFMLADTAQIDTYEATDDYTLVVTLKNPVPYFEALLSFPVFSPVSEAFVAEVGDQFGTTADTALYNGPFYLSTWTLGEEHVLTKNPEYYNAADVMLDAVNFRIIAGGDNNTLVTLYLEGATDRTALSGENVDMYKNREDAVVVPSPVLFYISFNQGE